jgi:hypothetical protein
LGKGKRLTVRKAFDKVFIKEFSERFTENFRKELLKCGLWDQMVAEHELGSWGQISE